MRWAIAAIVSISAAGIGGQDGHAEDAAEFYKGKTLRIILGVGVGGGFEAYANMLAPYIAKALGATVVVESVPGAGQLIAINRIYAAPPDGLNILLLNGTPAALGQILGQDNARYDLTKMEHLGIVNASPWMWLAGPKSGIRTARDAMKPGRKVLWGGTGPTGGLADGASITCEALHLDCKVIIGYKASSDTVLAIERGELDCIYVSDSSAVHYVESKRLDAVAAVARQRSKLLPDVPHDLRIRDVVGG